MIETGDQRIPRYYVWCYPSGAVSDSINNYEDAIKRAKKLSEQNKGFEFLVLRAICGIKYRTDPYAMRSFTKSRGENK